MITRNKFYGKSEVKAGEKRETLEVRNGGRVVDVPAEDIRDHHHRVSEWLDTGKFKFYSSEKTV